MFVGFIAVVVILLVVVGLMSSGSNSAGDGARYITEAKKVRVLTHLLSAESKFYYAKNETFSNLSMNYFQDVEFGGQNMVNQIDAGTNMAMADWSGWPVADGGFPDPYTGPYLTVGGIAGDELRIIATSINSGKNMAVYLVKKNVNTIDTAFLQTLEKTLASDSNFVGS